MDEQDDGCVSAWRDRRLTHFAHPASAAESGSPSGGQAVLIFHTKEAEGTEKTAVSDDVLRFPPFPACENRHGRRID